MYKIIFVVLLLISSSVSSNDNLLTIQQQLERLQREVSDLSETVFSNKKDNTKQNKNDLVKNLSAIDMRIYDLEKDVKNLTGSLEEIYFKIEDLILQINEFKTVNSNIEKSILEIKNKSLDTKTLDNESNQIVAEEKNTLGSLKISSENKEKENKIDESINSQKIEKQLSPEEQFQAAFDNIRSKNWEEAKLLLKNFIINNPESQLSGSAHYWLGELYILENQYRDAALILAEGYQKFPDSIKSPDILFKLSQSLYEVNKIEDSCRTLEKLIIDFPKNKFIKNAKKSLQEYGCLNSDE